MRYKYFLALLGLTFTLVVGAILSYPDQNLHLIFCDVGQGDAILVVKGKNQVLIDAGPGEKVLGCLSQHLPFWDKTLELVILTHPEADHAGGLPSVLERYNVRQLVSNSLITESGIFQKLREQVATKQIPVYSPKVGDKIKIEDLEIGILFPLEKQGTELVWQKLDDPKVLGIEVFPGNLNETSIVSLLKYQDFEALLPGDIGIEEEEKLKIGDVEVLKIAHHGSKYSTSPGFLEKTTPELAIISVGATNRYGHPTPEVLERLRNLEIKILRTDLDGEVEIVSDGENWYTKPK